MTVRWFVRGTDDSHEYDRSIVAPRGYAFCAGCVVFHSDPVGSDWHIEGSDVDTMLCGLRIELDDGAVRIRPARNICPRCLAAADEEDR